MPRSLSLTCLLFALSSFLPPSVKVCSILPSLAQPLPTEPERRRTDRGQRTTREGGWAEEDFSILAHQWLSLIIKTSSCVKCPLSESEGCTKRWYCLPSGRNAPERGRMRRRSGSLPTLDELTPPPPRESLLHLRTYLFCATAPPEDASAVSTSSLSLICDGLNQKLFPETLRT